ncbi:hypothetical protein CDAR_611811 [Caerostris darwini]|uniref:Uncharacterized protein n=1 Tax=Caerostris darwini TaxID=1538125 RepID=A0AAV4MU89_9ARAC|nr:hypothetical protein CDAR_611811 [Caerostris darwini]
MGSGSIMPNRELSDGGWNPLAGMIRNPFRMLGERENHDLSICPVEKEGWGGGTGSPPPPSLTQQPLRVVEDGYF